MPAAILPFDEPVRLQALHDLGLLDSLPEAFSDAVAAAGAVLPLLMVVLMFGIFALTPAQLLGLGAATLGVFGLTIIKLSHEIPEQYPPTERTCTSGCS